MTSLDQRIRERLTSLGNEACLGGCGCEDSRCIVYGFDEMRVALLAVLDLHKRHDKGLGYGSREEGGYGTVPDVCGECGKIDEYAQKWPCPTVRAIAKALGVEVDGG